MPVDPAALSVAIQNELDAEIGPAPLGHEADREGIADAYARAIAGVVNGDPASFPRFSDDEVPAGAVDGANKVFTLAHSPNPAASLRVYRAGVLQRRGVAYTLAGGVITFAVAPPGGQTLAAFYRY